MMQRDKVIIGSLAAVVVFCFGYQAHPDTVVKTEHSVKVIRVPKVMTKKVVEEKVIVKHVGMPESCETAIDYAQATTDATNGVNNQGKRFYKYIDQLDRRSMTDRNAVSKTDQYLGNQSEAMDTELYRSFMLAEEAKTSMKECTKDIAKAEAGEPFDAADGVPVVTP